MLGCGMRSLAHAFDAHVRVLECRGCGATATTALTSDQFQCAYCRAVNVYTLPPRQQPPSPEHDELPFDAAGMQRIENELRSSDRVAWLRAQGPSGGSRLLDTSAHVPQGLTSMAGLADWNTWTGEWLPALREKWQAALPAEGHSLADGVAQHRVYWLAMRLDIADDARWSPRSWRGCPTSFGLGRCPTTPS